jgi:hypothetical protein
MFFATVKCYTFISQPDHYRIPYLEDTNNTQRTRLICLCVYLPESYSLFQDFPHFTKESIGKLRSVVMEFYYSERRVLEII